MRLVFYSPLTARIGHHLNEFVRFKSINAYRKYHHFITEFLNNKHRKTAILIDLTGLAGIYFRLKCWSWMLINRINPLRVPLIAPHQLNPESDTLFAFPFLSFSAQALAPNSVFHLYPGLKAFHFSHYFESPDLFCPFIRSLKNTLVLHEGNLPRNPLYQMFMTTQPSALCPFVLRERYQSLRPFTQRKKKCFAFGTKSKLSPVNNRALRELFQTEYLHKLREEIFRKQKDITEYLDTFIYDYNELGDYKPKNQWERFKHYFLKKFGNDRRRFFSFDIVQKYNEYQMFVAPEEESGAPSISFIEGMACGCAYLGNSESYADYGMVPGFHFIGYDGTLDGLIKAVEFHQKHPEITEQIAQTGRNFVHEKFPAKVVAEGLWNTFKVQTKNTMDAYISKPTLDKQCFPK